MSTAAREQILRWLDEAVIGLGLCPFAASVRQSVHLRISDVSDDDGAISVALEEAARLIDSPQIPTTLVAFTRTLGDFRTFIDTAGAVSDALDAAGAAGILQVATFHPDYRFAGDGGVGNFTNRAPYPILHLLREHDISEAIARHPDPEGIPHANIARLEALGADEIARLWSRFRRES